MAIPCHQFSLDGLIDLGVRSLFAANKCARAITRFHRIVGHFEAIETARCSSPQQAVQPHGARLPHVRIHMLARVAGPLPRLLLPVSRRGHQWLPPSGPRPRRISLWGRRISHDELLFAP